MQRDDEETRLELLDSRLGFVWVTVVLGRDPASLLNGE